MLLALDFDGVISNSAPECFVVALRTYLGKKSDSSLGLPVGFRTGPAPAPQAVKSTTLYAPFLELMPLGNRAEDFGIALLAIEAGVTLRDQADYDGFRAGLSEGWLAEFHASFYAERTALAADDPAGWLKLMEPYPEFIEILRRRAADATLAIATAKDRPSVERLLDAYGVGDLFTADRVLDKETGVSKVAHLRILRERESVAFGDITFIDDKLNHLDSVAALGVRCALASWGYNGAREVALAHERGYLVCSLVDVEQQLLG